MRMLKRMFFSVAIISFGINLFSQSCLPEGLVLYTQEQVDNFHNNYPGCTEIEGSLIIGGDDITNLHGLIGINKVCGELRISYTNSISSLKGLDSLRTVGYIISIVTNSALTNLEGLEKLESIEGSIFEIVDNGSLVNLKGLEGLKSFDGALQIVWNNNLINLEGLNNLYYLRSLSVVDNDNLINLSGLNGLKNVFSPVQVNSNDKLLDLTGLNNLESVYGEIEIKINKSLKSLHGLEKLLSVNRIYINKNYKLEDISAIQNVDFTISFYTSLSINYNDSLFFCGNKAVCNAIANPNINVYIEYNKTGCNSKAEVAEDCGHQSIEEAPFDSEFSIFPNPFKDEVVIEFMPAFSGNQLYIMNIRGQEVYYSWITTSTSRFNLGDLPAGIYFVKIISSDKVRLEKLIKQ